MTRETYTGPITRWTIYAAGLLVTLLLAQCAGERASRPVTLKGSDTMVILGQRWAETYMAHHPHATIQVTGGGSGTGIAALINGTTDICQASRPMKDEEKQQIAQKYGAPPIETLVAKDGLSIYLNEKNPVKELSFAQLKDIYTGQVTNWKQVGGASAPITCYGRENNSGTYTFFKEHVLGNADYAPGVQALPGTAAVVNAVAKDANSIGYGGAAYAQGVHDCAVKKDASSPAVLPSEATVHDGSYPIARGLFWYTRKAPEGAIKDFVDFALSDSGQALAKEVGYFPAR